MGLNENSGWIYYTNIHFHESFNTVNFIKQEAQKASGHYVT